MIARRSRVAVDGRAAFISGAASGIGAAMARRLSAHGCPLAVVDQDGDGLRQTAAAIGGPVLARELDVRDAAAQAAFAAEVADWAAGPIGLVFNNAGVTTVQPVAGADVRDDRWVIDVNFGGVVHGVRAFLPILRRQGSGVIVNTSSVFGLLGYPAQSAYCASKFAVRGFTEALRHELRGSGVSAVTVLPGGVRTSILRNARYHGDPARRDSHAGACAQFDAIVQTTPERAAQIIHEGVRAGRSRILVGPDAAALDVLTRLAPNAYMDLLRLGERLQAVRRR